MASIQARHSRRCGLERPWTAMELPDACTCAPTYYTVVRRGSRLLRERVGKNRRDATRALARVSVAVDGGSYLAPRNVSFDDWADEWVGGLRRAKESTLHGYRSTLEHAKGAFGGKRVRDLTIADVTNLLAKLECQGPISVNAGEASAGARRVSRRRRPARNRGPKPGSGLGQGRAAQAGH